VSDTARQEHRKTPPVGVGWVAIIAAFFAWPGAKEASAAPADRRCSLTLFREKGYEATRIQDVIEVAEVSEGTFFNEERLLGALAIFLRGAAPG
jgi:hypothetical protein